MLKIKQFLIASVSGALLLAVVACGNGGGNGASTEYSTETLPMDQLITSLIGTDLILVDWKGVESLPGAAEETGREVRISFLEEGRFAAQGPVNRIAGQVEIDADGYLVFDERMISTKMAGPTEAMDLEVRFMNELMRVREITRDMDTFVFASNNGEWMHFVRVNGEE